jgi:hypothetical protein
LISLDTLFLTAYIASLGLIWVGLVLVGGRVYRNPWAIAALGAAFTMRHRIPRTSANSFVPDIFHILLVMMTRFHGYLACHKR